MWEKDGDDIIVDKRHKVRYFVTVAIVSQDEYEQRFEGFYDTVEEAKAALAKKFIQLKAEDEEEPWQIDEKGNASFGANKIIRVKLTDGIQSFGYAVVKQIFDHGKHCCDEILAHKKTDEEAREAIAEIVDELNVEA